MSSAVNVRVVGHYQEAADIVTIEFDASNLFRVGLPDAEYH